MSSFKSKSEKTKVHLLISWTVRDMDVRSTSFESVR
jgi:hypothetical protein